MQKDFETKMKINQSLNKMKVQARKMDTFKETYIKQAREAKLSGNKQTYDLAKNSLKLCISKRKFLDSMIGNFEIALQLNEMNKVVNEFVGGMNLIAEDLKGVTSTLDISKAQAAYQKAIANNEGQYQALDAFLQEAQSGIEQINESCEDYVTDKEIDALINNEQDKIDDDLDEKIEEKIQSLSNF